MTYAYFTKNNNEIDVKEVNTIYEITKKFGISTLVVETLSNTVRELSKLKTIKLNIDFHGVLYRINELEEVLKVLFIHNPEMTILEEIDSINYLYDLIMGPIISNKNAVRIKTIKPRNIFVSVNDFIGTLQQINTNKKEKFSFKEVDNEKISNLIKKEDIIYYTFTMSKKDPNKIVIKRVDEEIAKELENPIEGDLSFTKDWLAIPNLSASTSSESLLKELNKLETYLRGVLVSNPGLTIKGEIECIRKYNAYIEELVELSSGDKYFRNNLINLLLED